MRLCPTKFQIGIWTNSEFRSFGFRLAPPLAIDLIGIEVCAELSILQTITDDLCLQCMLWKLNQHTAEVSDVCNVGFTKLLNGLICKTRSQNPR